jgi:hypothetical protein
MFTSLRRLIAASALALGIAASILPTAHAGIRPDDRASRLGVGPVAVSRVASVRPDDRATSRGPGALFTTPTLVTTSTSGFEWGAAAFGAAAALAATSLAAVAAFSRRRPSRVAH